MKRVLGVLGIILLIACGLIYSYTQRIADGRNLPAEHSVKMRIASGGVTVIGSKSNDYRVIIDNPDPEIVKQAHINIDRKHRPVLIEISDLPQNSKTRVEIPEDSNLAVMMGAGELIVTGVQGDKYAMLRAGKLVIDVGDHSGYSEASGSVLAGALDAPAFSANKGGMFRCLRARAGGSHKLAAHVSSGQLVLTEDVNR